MKRLTRRTILAAAPALAFGGPLLAARPVRAANIGPPKATAAGAAQRIVRRVSCFIVTSHCTLVAFVEPIAACHCEEPQLWPPVDRLLCCARNNRTLLYRNNFVVPALDCFAGHGAVALR